MVEKELCPSFESEVQTYFDERNMSAKRGTDRAPVQNTFLVCNPIL
jgi:hypothetical protein